MKRSSEKFSDDLFCIIFHVRHPIKKLSDDLSALSDTSSDLVFSALYFTSHSSLKFIKKLNAYNIKNPQYRPVANRAMVYLIRLKNINYLVF